MGGDQTVQPVLHEEAIRPAPMIHAPTATAETGALAEYAPQAAANPTVEVRAIVDVCLAGPRPHVRIRASVAKGGRSRRVPLWWDAGTLADLVAWRGERVAQGGRDADPFNSSVQAHRRGQSLQRYALRRRFLTACKARLHLLTIHHGRHTFISHALAGGACGSTRCGRAQQCAGD